jgi:hypothetical protein
MEKIYFNFLLFLIPFSCFCQQKQINHSNKNEAKKEISADANDKNNLLDWQIDIPAGFSIISEGELEDLDFGSKEGNSDKEITTLISFRKGKQNIFTAAYESLQDKEKITFEEHKSTSLKVLQEMYSKEGIKFDVVNSDLRLGQYDFYKILIHMYSQTSKLVLTQEIYSSYINNHLFTAVILYEDENLGSILRENFITSFK